MNDYLGVQEEWNGSNYEDGYKSDRFTLRDEENSPNPGW